MAARKSDPIADFVKEHGTEGTISASQLTDLVTTVTGKDRDAKTIRSYLRRMKARDQSQYKNAQWRVDPETAQAVVDHFAEAKKVTA